MVQHLTTDQLKDLSAAELIDRAKQLQWVHSIDLGNGFVTPGIWGTGNPFIIQGMNDIDFTGKKVLDIGCWDGAYSFMAERLGASEVYSTDLVSQRNFEGSPTYQIAHAATHSRARYIPTLSVYDVESLGIRDFDVVLFTGIYYHLKDPLRALTCLRRVMKTGAVILVEGAILTEPGCFAKFFYREAFCGDNSNWWVPTVECLRQWVECSFLKIENQYDRWGGGDNHRHTLIARAVRHRDPLYVWVPEDLEEYNL
jgi:tRNA (mo5U34)-methyltransferase